MQRDTNLDSTKGILIFLVVFGHLIEPLRSTDWVFYIWKFIYIFHMPAFIFISGMLTRTVIDTGYAKKLVERIIVPLIIFEILHLALDYFLKGSLPKYIVTLTPHWTLWFLISLFCWRIITPVILATRFPLTISILTAIIALSAPKVGGFLSIARTFSFLPFYVLGLVYGHQIINFLKENQNKLTILLSILVLAGIAMLAPDIKKHILFGSYSFKSMKLPFIEGTYIRIYIYILSTIAILSILSLSLKTTRFARWGELSLTIYLWHSLIIRVIKHYSDNNAIKSHPIASAITYILIAIFICYLTSTDFVDKVTKLMRKSFVFILTKKTINQTNL